MINLRYHIVSIVAVFLALGIGVALGSSFIDGVVLDRLRTSVDTLQEDRDQLRETVSSLEVDLVEQRAEAQNDLATILPVNAIGRLEGVPVMIIASDGVSDEAWTLVRDTVVATDADYEGTLWLGNRLDLSVEENREDMAETFNLVNSNESLVRPALTLRLDDAFFPESPDAAASVLGSVASDIADELLEGEGDIDEPVVAPTRLASVLVTLRDGGYLRHDTEFARTGALDELPAFGTLFILLSGQDAELSDDEFLYPLMRTGVTKSSSNLIIAIEPTTPGVRDDDNAVAFVGPIRRDAELAGAVATIDSVDSIEGLLSLVAIADRGDPAHVGLDPTAASRLPNP